MMSRNAWLALLIALCGLVYVGNAWSPSSYGIVLKEYLGLKDQTPSVGRYRSIRSDEWGVVTPLTQATVRNHFERFNHTSLYGEDLRINYGLPIHDWGIVFKPTMWLYGVVPPAIAYSFHWYALLVMFLVGHRWLAGWLGATPTVAWLWSVGFFFTGAIQFWWNEKGPVFAFWPLILAAMVHPKLPTWGRATLVYFLATSWFLTNFYPPYQVGLAFAMLALLAARSPSSLHPRQLWPFAIAALAASATAVLYLWDYLQATAQTVYPGARQIVAGDGQWLFAMTWLFPPLLFDHKYNALIANTSEIGTVGLYLTLFAVAFADRDALRVWIRDRVLAVLLVAWLLMMAWSLWSGFPTVVGKMFLWNHIPGNRIHYVCGTLLALIVLRIMTITTFSFRWSRWLALLVILLLAWRYPPVGISQNGVAPAHNLLILFFLPLLCLAIAVKHWPRMTMNHTMLSVSLVLGFLLFGRFNPLQSAYPIFNVPSGQRLTELQESTRQHGDVLTQNLFGCVGNGLGVKSIPHVLATPRLDIWKSVFPTIPEAELRNTFNRYAHIRFGEDAFPRAIQPDLVEIPKTAIPALQRYSRSSP